MVAQYNKYSACSPRPENTADRLHTFPWPHQHSKRDPSRLAVGHTVAVVRYRLVMTSSRKRNFSTMFGFSEVTSVERLNPRPRSTHLAHARPPRKEDLACYESDHYRAKFVWGMRPTFGLPDSDMWPRRFVSAPSSLFPVNVS